MLFRTRHQEKRNRSAATEQGKRHGFEAYLTIGAVH
uniref:Uncharacterized protein n=1 Tax=Manihot esculenta TaxID=3983 RepID=A0A2C9W2J0_MANES